MVTVRLPSTLREPHTPEAVIVEAEVATIGDLIQALDYQHPGLGSAIDESLFNFSVNHVLVLHRPRLHPVFDGDVVEILSTMAG